MKRMLQVSGWFFLISLLLLSCRKPQHYSEIPEIGYKSFTLRDTTDLLGNKGLVGELTFTFVDGDGNIGLHEPDVEPGDTIDPEDPKYTNLFFTLYVMKKGILTIPDDIEIPLNYRIPYMEPEGQDPSIKGEIKVEFLYILFKYDTLLYDFYITDRTEPIPNESNVESTPLIILPKVNN